MNICNTIIVLTHAHAAAVASKLEGVGEGDKGEVGEMGGSLTGNSETLNCEGLLSIL